jgi:hypothetical protein
VNTRREPIAAGDRGAARSSGDHGLQAYMETLAAVLGDAARR